MFVAAGSHQIIRCSDHKETIRWASVEKRKTNIFFPPFAHVGVSERRRPGAPDGGAVHCGRANNVVGERRWLDAAMRDGGAKLLHVSYVFHESFMATSPVSTFKSRGGGRGSNSMRTSEITWCRSCVSLSYIDLSRWIGTDLSSEDVWMDENGSSKQAIVLHTINAFCLCPEPRWELQTLGVSAKLRLLWIQWDQSYLCDDGRSHFTLWEHILKLKSTTSWMFAASQTITTSPHCRPFQRMFHRSFENEFVSCRPNATKCVQVSKVFDTKSCRARECRIKQWLQTGH